jgi:hypothetical protein
MFLGFSDGRPISSYIKKQSANRLNEHSDDNIFTLYGLMKGETVSIPVEIAKVETGTSVRKKIV